MPAAAAAAAAAAAGPPPPLLLVFLAAAAVAGWLPDGGAPGRPRGPFEGHPAPEEQQTLHAILAAIEERLRHLDNAYSSQFPQTLDTKLDQYQRKLEALETKIATLSTGLEKLSENVSARNIKEDITKTEILSKLDAMHEGINGKISDLDKKTEDNDVKLNIKVDAIVTGLETIEKSLQQKSSEIESELSDAIFAIDEIKSSTATMEQNLMNVTSETLNETRAIRVLVDSNSEILSSDVTDRLKQLDNAIGEIRNATIVGNELQHSIKTEIKNDLNEYASKVADMNSELWSGREALEAALQTSIAHNIRTEVQKSIKSLITLSPVHGYSIGSNNYQLEEISQTLNKNFEAILNNQYKFLDSCHRVQMDESQIESEISITLDKLINMLENRLNGEAESVKNLEKLIKSHDSRILRNLNQANINIVTLVAKSSKSDEIFEKEIANINKNIHILYTYMQKVLPEEKLSVLMTTIQNISLETYKVPYTTHLKEEFHSLKVFFEEKLSSCLLSPREGCRTGKDTRKVINSVFENNPHYNKTRQPEEINEDYSKLIDLRYEGHNKHPCTKDTSQGLPKSLPTANTHVQKCKIDNNGNQICGIDEQMAPKRKYRIDLRNTFTSSEDIETDDKTTPENISNLDETTLSVQTTDATDVPQTTLHYNSS